MKKHILTHPHFHYLHTEFMRWLSVTGYNPKTIQAWSNHSKEFLHYLETVEKITDITQVKPKHTQGFAQYLDHRTNTQTFRGRGLRQSTINAILISVNAFGRFLSIVRGYTLDVEIPKITQVATDAYILTPKDIHRIYDATFSTKENPQQPYGQRDRAMLGIFYGCGVRRHEGRMLDLSDINISKRTVHIRHGKGCKERTLPIATQHFQDLETYINEGRLWFIQKHNRSKDSNKGTGKATQALFVSRRGTRLMCYYRRLDALARIAGVEHKVGLHTLRHSVATHLFYNGMKLQDISLFLGHSSLESTQIYTHIVHSLNADWYV